MFIIVFVSLRYEETKKRTLAIGSVIGSVQTVRLGVLLKNPDFTQLAKTI